MPCRKRSGNSSPTGLGISFGGAGAEAVFGGQMGNVLTRTTVILAVVFLANTTLLAILILAALLAVLQADALIARDDFRGDERALQLVGTLCRFAPRVLIQTAVPARFCGARSLDELLDERCQFSFPPYTRLVEFRRQGSGEVLERHFLARDRQLAARKAELLSRLPDGCYPDVDPVD